MSVVIPLLIPKVRPKRFGDPDSTGITRIISLHNPVPAFQAGFDAYGNPYITSPSDPTYTRNLYEISTGFPHSVETVPTGFVQSSEYVIPPHAYTVQPPTAALDIAMFEDDGTMSLLLLDVSAAPIEPGFSRLRVDYLSDANNGDPATVYIDMPFWEDWDLHPRQLQEVIDYTNAAVKFLQEEIKRLKTTIDFQDRHFMLRGLSVSGQIFATVANQNLEQNLVPHSANLQKSTTSRPLKPLSNVEKSPPLINPLVVLHDTIVSVSPAKMYPGDTITVTLSNTPDVNDKLYIFATQFPTVVDTANKTLTMTLPSWLPYAVDLPLIIGNNRKAISDPLNVHVYAKPKALSFEGPQGVAFGTPSDTFLINGRDFQDTPGTVTFTPGISATISTWTNQRIVGMIPAGAVTGLVSVGVDGFTSTLNFTAASPLSLETFTVTPNVAAMNANGTVAFTAILDGITVTPNWSLVTDTRNIGSGNLTYGMIDATGLYTAPALVTSPFTLKIAANYTSQSGPVTTHSSIAVLPTTNTFTLSPSATTISPGDSTQFTVNGIDPNSVTWLVNGVAGGSVNFGSISNSGIYTAPTIAPVTGAVYVSAEAVVSGTLSAVSSAVRILGSPLSGHALDDDKDITTTNGWFQSHLSGYSILNGTFNLHYPAPVHFSLFNGYSTQVSDITGYAIATLNDSGCSQAGSIAFGTPSATDLLLPASFNQSIAGRVYPSTLPTGAPVGASVAYVCRSYPQHGATWGGVAPAWVPTQYHAMTFPLNSGQPISAGAVIGVNSNVFLGQNDWTFAACQYLGTTSGTITDGIRLGQVYLGLRAVGSNDLFFYNDAQSVYTRATGITAGTGIDVIIPEQNTGGGGGGGTGGGGRTVMPLLRRRPTMQAKDTTSGTNGDAMWGTLGFTHTVTATAAYEVVVMWYDNFTFDHTLVSGTCTTDYHMSPAYVTNLSTSVTGNTYLPSPTLTSISGACPSQRAVVTGKYFAPNVQAYINGTNELMPIVAGSLVTSDNINYTFAVTVPGDIPTNATGLSVYVKGSNGQSNTVPFTIPASCSVPPPPPLTVTGPANVCAGNTTQFVASLGTTNVTTQCVWSSNAGGGVQANDGVFHAPAGVGTYSMNATYQGQTAGASIVVQNCAPTLPTTTTCNELLVTPATPIINLPYGTVQFTAWLALASTTPVTTRADQWLVNDISGGTPQLGTIDANGLYTAPGYLPEYIHVKITAKKTIPI